MTQLPLPFDHTPRYGPEDFVPSPSNAAARAAIDHWPDWPDRVLLVIGPSGSGKSHLARIWAARAEARILRPDDFAHDVEPLARRHAVVEDADTAGLPDAALFHFLNLIREGGVSALITARTPPSAWPVATADLVSRLRLAPTVTIEPPDEALMRAVLTKLFTDRQLVVDDTLLDYLTLRLDRSLDDARSAVAALDLAGLDGKRRITRNLAAKLFGDPALDED